jgi:hypothetical protein
MVIVGYGFVGVEVVSIPAIVISYAIDAYKSLPGQIMVSATIVKNTFGFGMIFFFNDWAVKNGFIPPVMTLMALAASFTTLGMVVFLKWGKNFHRMTMNSNYTPCELKWGTEEMKILILLVNIVLCNAL